MSGESNELFSMEKKAGGKQTGLSQKKRTEAYTYMVRCGDGSFYTGWTYDPEKRVAAHNSGKGAKYTKSRLPVELIYAERFSTKEEAMSREYAIKQLTRAEKERLIRQRGEHERVQK